MDVRFSILLTCVCLLAVNNHVVLGRICWKTYLKEIIKMLDNITKQKEKENIDILCQAATVIKNITCIKCLRGIYLNLHKLIKVKVLCPATADNHIKLKHFLEKLKDLSQSIMKEKTQRKNP
ncbi:interleukin-4 [Pelodiscus sinensis]|uniref:interleukin-4 n=1 Tax=Pelodiscus sinensis TaxID=13735 RepID=UPI003F6B6229